MKIWKVLKHSDYLTPKILGLLEELELETLKVYKLDHTLDMLEVSEGEKKVVMPIIRVGNNEPVRTISSLVSVQNWEWYSNDLEYFLEVCEANNIDAVNLNVETGVDGQSNALVSATSMESYVKSRSRSTRQQLNRIIRRELNQIKWKWACKETDLKEVKEMVIEDTSWWCSQDSTGYEKLAKIAGELFTELGFSKDGKVRLGYQNGELVCCYIWLEFEGIQRSLKALRDRESELQLGHIMQLDKVRQIANMGGEFDLGMCNMFPHKVSWSTRVVKLGAVGEGFNE